MAPVPPLRPKQPGLGVRAAALVVPGIRRVSAQIEPYTRYWSDRNQLAISGTDGGSDAGPLLVAIGDSTAIGIGATEPGRSYVGLLAEALAHRDGRPWRVINLAQSGAKVADGLDRQLPALAALADHGIEPDAVVCCLGSNDVVWSADTVRVRRRLQRLIIDLPAASTVGLAAGVSPRARLVNRAVRQAAAEAGHTLVDPWREPGPGPLERVAEDRFHPNDLGYVLMARPFARSFGAPEPDPDLATVPEPGHGSEPGRDGEPGRSPEPGRDREPGRLEPPPSTG